ncbi:MAG: hypothetical protein HYX82_03820 [Chloroflexi bacterium]|nr:hypothetical protein [Chloroflexota bacterium]
MDRRSLKKALSTLRCNVCGRRYQSFNIRILGHEKGIWFIGVLCISCKSKGLVAAVIQDAKDPERVTDLTEGELSTFSGRPPVNMDDVLDIHNVLKDFQGEIGELVVKR